MFGLIEAEDTGQEMAVADVSRNSWTEAQRGSVE